MLKRNKQWNKSHKVEHKISPLPKNQNDFAQIRAMISGKSSHPRPEKGSEFSYNDPQDARECISFRPIITDTPVDLVAPGLF